MDQVEYRACTDCGKSLPLAEFTRDGRGGRRRKCRACRAKWRKEWREANRGKHAQYQRRFALAAYGLTEAEYEAMLAVQGGVCAMCGRSCRTGRKLAVDHDHQSGRVRALLCVVCNQSLGVYEAFRDAAANYLATYGEGNPNISHGAALEQQRQALRAKTKSGTARLDEDTVREIRARYAAGGETQRSLATEYGISQNAVSLVVRRKTWCHVADGPEVAKLLSISPTGRLIRRVRRLNDEQLVEIRQLHAAGASCRTLAKQFDVHHTTVMRLVAGKHWKAA
ncbi:endonuclease domain-containing protein [Streptomyces sp. NBC_00441]|uniref:endonuclease domain-containing protein n=1 Tax=Streptomyces sp. NBC_00441 TaxID=2975742 RepID=UPI002E2922A0|nr:endonuclease domain-containing protein [Streptomyces sp. NBC_00441]